jgi:hypothetical protein
MQNPRALFWAFISVAILSAAAMVIAAWMTSRPTSPATQPVTSTSGAPETSAVSTSCADYESLVVDFADGLNSAQTRNSYSGEVFLTVSGSGQSSSSEYTDAFYVFTDPDGNETFPSIIGFSLAINGRLAREFIPDQRVPLYRDDHVYSFSIMAPGGVLTFGVHDEYIFDNMGSYQVTVCKQ